LLGAPLPWQRLLGSGGLEKDNPKVVAIGAQVVMMGVVTTQFGFLLIVHCNIIKIFTYVKYLKL
jgi:hypothetical protein